MYIYLYTVHNWTPMFKLFFYWFAFLWTVQSHVWVEDEYPSPNGPIKIIILFWKRCWNRIRWVSFIFLGRFDGETPIPSLVLNLPNSFHLKAPSQWCIDSMFGGWVTHSKKPFFFFNKPGRWPSLLLLEPLQGSERCGNPTTTKPKPPPSTQTRKQMIVFVMSWTIHVNSLSDGSKQMRWSDNLQIVSCFTLQSTQENRRQKSSTTFYCMVSLVYGAFSLSDCLNPSWAFVMWNNAAKSRWRTILHIFHVCLPMLSKLSPNELLVFYQWINGGIIAAHREARVITLSSSVINISVANVFNLPDRIFMHAIGHLVLLSSLMWNQLLYMHGLNCLDHW